MHLDRRWNRCRDIALAGLLLIATAPLVTAAAIVSLLVYRAWPLFTHQRIGIGGTPFRFMKIRTLPPATSRYADKYALATDELPAIMRLIRRTHLDELPQLWHVLSGRMSLVGPRPEMAALLTRLDPAIAAERLSVRPGVTGLWQVSPHCDALIVEFVQYDRLYVRHQNALLDAWIMLKTADKMFRGRTVHLHDVPRWAIGEAREIDLTLPAHQPRSLQSERAELALVD